MNCVTLYLVIFRTYIGAAHIETNADKLEHSLPIARQVYEHGKVK